MLTNELTLFVEPIKLQNIMPWVVVAIAVVVLLSILIKCFSIYRNIKRNRTYVKPNGEEQQQRLLSIRGEYFVLSGGVEYSVGLNGQLKAGKYLLRGDGYDKFQLSINGQAIDFDGDTDREFADGDVIVPACDTLIKPIVTKEEKI
ncbi:MAG: hypothetical protein J1G02_02225 [Clostridiales bacterium]|nr:hypothetical protein [Clostridiales bacterium]